AVVGRGREAVAALRIPERGDRDDTVDRMMEPADSVVLEKRVLEGLRLEVVPWPREVAEHRVEGRAMPVPLHVRSVHAGELERRASKAVLPLDVDVAELEPAAVRRLIGRRAESLEPLHQKPPEAAITRPEPPGA